MVAILSLGAARSLLLRPRGGGVTIRKQLGPGDLIVMGGSCQRTWEHCDAEDRAGGRAADQRPVPTAGRAVIGGSVTRPL